MAPTALTAFAPELRLLICYGRPESSRKRCDLVRAAASEPLCWSRFLSLTRRHRVVPQAWEVLRQDAADLVPRETMDSLQHAEELVELGWLTASARQFQRAAQRLVTRTPTAKLVLHVPSSEMRELSGVVRASDSTAQRVPPHTPNRRAA